MEICASEMKICFIQDESFLRTKRNTNPFFDPIIRVCEKNGIDWEIGFKSLPKECGYQRNRIFSLTIFSFFETYIWRIAKCIHSITPRIFQITFAKVWKKFGGSISNANLYITIAGNMIYELAAMYPNKRIIDLQHGVIYSGHKGYFLSNARLSDGRRTVKNIEFWLYGDGYADCFFKNPENAKDLEGRVKIIGDVARANAQVEGCRLKVEGSERNLVVMSLQLTDDLDQEEKAGSVKVMEEFFSEFFKKYGDKYTVLFKHHPRFNNCYDLSEFYKKFPQIKESKTPWGELYPKMALHLTFNSTSIFDCAAVGIPTFLLDLPGAKVCHRDLYRDDFGYPLYDKNVDEILDKQEECGKISLEWYRRCYAPFDEENCLKLLKGEV